MLKPADYFPDQYLKDIVTFADQMVTHRGPFLSLCGWGLSRLFEPTRFKKYSDSTAFLCVLYNLNLLNQGIYTYFQSDHRQWLDVCPPFPNSRGCVYHGSVIRAPSSVLKFALDPSYIAGAQPIEVSEKCVREYTKFFMEIYLPQLCKAACFLTLSPEILVDRLLVDPDCPEFIQYIAGGA